MQVGLARSKAGLPCCSQQAGNPPRPQQGSRLRSPTDASVKALRVVPKAAKVEEVGLDSSLSNGATGASNPLAFDELTDIIRMVHDTDIVELELRSKRFSLAVRKKEAIEAPEPTVIYQQAPSQQGPPQYAPQASYAAPPMPAPQAPAAAPAPAAPASNGQAPPPAVLDGVEVASPMAGTVYRSPAPGEPHFVKEGDKVTKGQTICIIEAMKLMNEIEAEITGTLVKFIADNGASVVPGQPIALIKP
ncbi:Biotin carboxyl carrier protein of acetyl-CoA carboxylase [Coccomyxa sp. Obi]|nr:acetyl-CoA carboxylase-2 [Coccomyxa sp. Obi]BDA41481.1 Biotin carboxyl carrier protein of acetyl-CoA carboxylase [Coccomyxa sp. Obi]